MFDNGVHGDNSPKQKEQAKTKRCPKCGETKTLTEYYKNKHGKYGVQYNCKVCMKAYLAKYYAENREKLSARHAKYRAENAELHRARASRWRAENREKRRAQKQRRRAKKRNAPGTFTASDWKAKIAYYGYKCIYCGVEKHETPQGWLTCEHLIPLSRGGSNWPSNLAPSCTSCNSSKGTKTHFEYLEFLDGQ